MDLMHFEPSQAPDMLGPVLVEQALDDVPIFGPDRKDLTTIVEEATRLPPLTGLVQDLDADDRILPAAFTKASTTAEKLRALRACVKEKSGQKAVDTVGDTVRDMSLSITAPPTNCELHEELLSTLIEAQGLPREARAVVDNVMLLRAKEKYLFDPLVNVAVVADDPWLKYLWGWVGGELTLEIIALPTAANSHDLDAEAANAESVMTAHPLDLSYLGVSTIWMNNLGATRGPHFTGFPTLHVLTH